MSDLPSPLGGGWIRNLRFEPAPIDSVPLAPGLLALAEGARDAEADDYRLLERESFVYDALYAWCQRQPSGSSD